MTTTTTRTLAEVLKSRAFVAKAIEDTEAFIAEVSGLAITNTIYVLGWPQHGLFLNSKDAVGGLMFARRFSDARMPSRMTVSNGKGERAYVVTLGRAREMVLEQQQAVLTRLEGLLQDADMEADDLAERETAEALAARAFNLQEDARIERQMAAQELVAVKADLQAMISVAAKKTQGLTDAISERDAALVREAALKAELAAVVAEAAKMAAIAAKTERELGRHRRAVDVALEFLDDRADADCDQDGFIANEELRASSDMRAILDGLC